MGRRDKGRGGCQRDGGQAGRKGEVEEKRM